LLVSRALRMRTFADFAGRPSADGQSLEDRSVGFQQSPLFTEWRRGVGPLFASIPAVDHSEQVMKPDTR